MKRNIILLSILLILIIIIVLINISNNRNKINDVKQFNEQFEIFNNKKLYGADILTIINKAIDNNELCEIEKNENGEYIDNGVNSIKIYITLLTKDDKENIVEVRHPMEMLKKAGLNEFIKSFSLTAFEYINIEYRSSGRISKIEVKQLEL